MDSNRSFQATESTGSRSFTTDFYTCWLHSTSMELHSTSIRPAVRGDCCTLQASVLARHRARSLSLPQPAPCLLFGQTGVARTYARLPDRGSTVPHSTVTNSSPGATWREKAAGECTQPCCIHAQPELVREAADSLTKACTSRQRPGVSAAGVHHRGGEHPGLGSRCSAAEQAAVLGHAQAGAGLLSDHRQVLHSSPEHRSMCTHAKGVAQRAQLVPDSWSNRQPTRQPHCPPSYPPPMPARCIQPAAMLLI